ncbi:MAG: hypothetical protein WBD20_21315 [Pirellulaceae bacterium]
MISTLLRKELVEHGWVFAILLPISLLGFVLVVAGTALQEVGSVLDTIRFFGLSFHILVTMVVCNRLVVQEYSGKTQLFLEGLPISRWAMLITKYCLGFAIVAGLMTICFLIASLVASRQEMIDAIFVQIMVARLFAYVFLTYSFFFMMGLLGRYRIPIYLAIIVGLMIFTDVTSFDVYSQGPLALLNDQFAFERVKLPTNNVLGCVAAGAVFVSVAMMMGLMREGSMASLMAERMSQREKLFASVGVLMLLFIGSSLDAKRVPDPYVIPDAYVRDEDDVTVHVESPDAFFSDGDQADQVAKLANAIHKDLVAVRRYLAIDEMPTLMLINRRDLDPVQYETPSLANASGVLLRMNYLSPEFDYAKVRPQLIDIALSHASHFNAIYEPQCWVLEGFSDYWPRRDLFSTQWSVESKTDARAVYGASRHFQPTDVDNWYNYRDRVGLPIARAVGCSGLVYAERKYGPERLQQFLQRVLRLGQPSDFRADWDQFRHPIDTIWKQTMGDDYRDFVAEWANELQLERLTFSETMRLVPQVSAKARWIAKSTITHELEVTPTCDPAPADGNVSVQHEEIGIFDTWTNDENVESQVEIYEPGKPIVVKDTFAAGDRMRWTVSVFSPELGCDVISGWQRQEVE